LIPCRALFTKNEAPHNGAPYRSISETFILLESLFRKEYRYGLIIFPFSTGENQQTRPRTDQPPLVFQKFRKWILPRFSATGHSFMIGLSEFLGTVARLEVLQFIVILSQSISSPFWFFGI
jgi:hypothetical protein